MSNWNKDITELFRHPEVTKPQNLLSLICHLFNKIVELEDWIDSQKAKPGAKDPIRSALHAHLDEVLNKADVQNKFNSGEARGQFIRASIHKFFRELMTDDGIPII